MSAVRGLGGWEAQQVGRLGGCGRLGEVGFRKRKRLGKFGVR